MISKDDIEAMAETKEQKKFWDIDSNGEDGQPSNFAKEPSKKPDRGNPTQGGLGRYKHWYRELSRLLHT